MKNSTRSIAVAAVFAGFAVSTAGADVITAKYTSSFGKSMNINSPVLNGDVNTVLFNWTRQDSPGPGVDSTIASTFNSYCIDLAQNVHANTNFTFTVKTPAEHGFTSSQETMLRRLFADHLPMVNSANTSAAFQIAVWEIIHDDEFNLGAGSFRVTGTGTPVTTASDWLSEVAAPSYFTENWLPELAVLHSSSNQDQITVVPAPATGALAALGLVGLAARRRR